MTQLIIKTVAKNYFYTIIFFIVTFCCLFGLLYSAHKNNYTHTNIQSGKPMYFKTIAETFEKIEAFSSRLEITKLLAELLTEASAQEAECICNLSLGLLRPSYQGGTQFNLAEKSLVKVVATFMQRPVEEIEQKTKELGDLGLVVKIIDYNVPSNPLSILEVYEKLLAIEQISGTGSQEEKFVVILELLKNLDPLSAKYILRMIMGKLRLGFSDMTLLDALSWMEVGNKSLHAKIEDAYNLCADIGLIARNIKEGGIHSIDTMRCQLGIPIRMAAAERLSDAEVIYDKLGDCVVQPKLDGLRLQVHLDKTNPEAPIIKFFSRNLLDMTSMFPDLAEAFKTLPVEQLICEGEAIAYNELTNNFMPFQETAKRKRKYGIEQAVTEYPLHIYLFDILFLNGQTVMNQSHTIRRLQLEEVLKQYQGTKIQLISEEEIHSPVELEHYFFESTGAGLEGIMVKKSNSVYQPGKRNFNWIKLKRIEQGNLDDTLDCVVLGYYKGSGKRASFGIGAFLVGVYNKDKDCFQTIAKVGTGLKDEGWRSLEKKCEAIKIHQQPVNVECPKELYPDVWTDPNLMCVVRADEITMSPLHTAGKTEHHLGYALRFPRFIEYRLDKSSEQATSTEEIKRLYQAQISKIS